eukprot:c23708_g1_i1 orf=204-1982(+)
MGACTWTCLAAPFSGWNSLLVNNVVRTSHRMTCSSSHGIHVRADIASTSRTQKIMESISIGREAGGAGGASSYSSLKRADEERLRICTMNPDEGQPPEVVRRCSGYVLEGSQQNYTDVFDVVVCGGTLGIFIAASLALRGFHVAVVERGILQGRVQEWNVSRRELDELVNAGILTAEDVEEVINAEFNPNRCGFEGAVEVWVKDILNLGVSPFRLIEIVKHRFVKLGGLVLEAVGLSRAKIYDDFVVLTLDNGRNLVSRLMVDAMGNFSPIVRQIRWGQYPDGVCLVVGSCARGFKNNSTSDIIYSNSPVMTVGRSKAQYFWEAFPAGSGPNDRTCYLFTYVHASLECPSLEELLDDYWDLMPPYQGVKLEDIEILRVLFGFFPTYRDSPLPAAFDRVLQVGDASGIQSPLSFGGFGSMTRHVGRIATGLTDALEADLLDKKNLALMNPYMPNLSGTWLFQRAMSARTDATVSPDFINDLLAINFKCMKNLGNPVVKPFLQDVIQFVPLAKTMGLIVISRPDILPSIFNQVGLPLVIEWFGHFVTLGAYTILSSFAAPYLMPWVQNLPKEDQYIWKRRFEAWKYGSGLDYQL